MGKEEKRVVLAAHEEAEQPAAEENTDWRNAGSIRDYLDAIGEQIENPHARCAIRREIGNHIEEQTLLTSKHSLIIAKSDLSTIPSR